MTHSHVTAPTEFVEAAGVRYAYRRFGAAEDVLLLFLQHFTGTMDFWDPRSSMGSRGSARSCSSTTPA